MNYEVDQSDLLIYCPTTKEAAADRDKLMRLVVPETLQQDILHHYHPSLQGGHQGIGRTYDRIRDHFHWRGLFKSVWENVLIVKRVEDDLGSRVINTKRGPTTYYQCSTYRSNDCKGKLNVKILDSGDSDVRETGEHSCRPVILPGPIWDRVSRELSAKYPSQAVKVLVRDEAINFINYTSRQAGGGDVYRQIETLPVVAVSESDDPFFYHAQAFQQTLVIMAHDPAYDVYIPVLTILLEAKYEWSYWHALHSVCVLGKMEMTPASVTCDFEAALIKGIRDQFPGIHVIGCLFHWKQAIRRKLMDLRFSANHISEEMTPGVLGILTRY
ncbi:hypothetical protein PHMEG_00039152 [Phytophthora megakarya]|uniref:Integrase zinc-binding domain-containing protein n=1 Tax=Phytophthora megakarya TaxID=4795 RepID=A0A225UGF3_9STRA|nr:hypothetical protein PHMEG_00039152 [Phytophthora megakarya]